MGISRQQALECFQSDDLVGIGMEADAVRRSLHPEGVVSYALDCEVDCSGVSASSVCAPVRDAVDAGATGVRLRGAVTEQIIRELRKQFPGIWIEGLSAAEVLALAGGAGLELTETLGRLRDEGLDAVGGEQGSCGVEDWLAVHRAAHGLGMRTVAEMVFGSGETAEQRVDLLEAIRGMQELTGGFAAFVPVAADPPNGRALDGVTAVERLKTLAIARMFLNNVAHVQAMAAGQGLKVLQMGLRFGANDAGPVAVDLGSSEEDVRRIIRDAGFRPVQRDMAYRAMMLS